MGLAELGDIARDLAATGRVADMDGRVGLYVWSLLASKTVELVETR